ncbi:hypothetical protein B0H65DRAFT_579061 [Neurospora tetraspora]|uniref:Uncharacterized protein n=1 Tax=Neurospora tetraspora TaxID=94610 RepID=A0AAE0JC21_9PEZI|nr:hypothetical protein B0H65DRAFT_579061 [Neurospora tetraspora]
MIDTCNDKDDRSEPNNRACQEYSPGPLNNSFQGDKLMMRKPFGGLAVQWLEGGWVDTLLQTRAEPIPLAVKASPGCNVLAGYETWTGTIVRSCDLVPLVSFSSLVHTGERSLPDPHRCGLPSARLADLGFDKQFEVSTCWVLEIDNSHGASVFYIPAEYLSSSPSRRDIYLGICPVHSWRYFCDPSSVRLTNERNSVRLLYLPTSIRSLPTLLLCLSPSHYLNLTFLPMCKQHT